MRVELLGRRDHDAWLEKLWAKGLVPSEVTPCKLHPKRFRTTSAVEAKHVHFHYPKDIAPSPGDHVAAEMCCHGCASGLTVRYPQPPWPGPYPVLAFIREAFVKAHEVCRKRFAANVPHRARAARLFEPAYGICRPDRIRAWRIEVQDVGGRAPSQGEARWP